MRVLFLTLSVIDNLQAESIYMDLMRCFSEKGHEVTIVSPCEKKYCTETKVERDNGLTLIRPKTGNLFGVNMVTKALSQLRLPYQYMRAIKKFAERKNVKKEDSSKAWLDLIIYSTPPITLAKIVNSIKRKTGAKTYLMLKDIFPQNAVDIGIMTDSGLRGMLYKYFRGREKRLYKISDYIGCMSPANMSYLCSHNDVNPERVEECPNSVKIGDTSGIPDSSRQQVLEKYNIPSDKVIFLYGGNLGKPQDIPHALKCVDKASKETGWAHFVFCGTGTEEKLVREYTETAGNPGFTFINGLPKKEYDELAACCDVGLVFLDHRFTIPNYPSRILSYMQMSKPVLFCVDKNTDVGTTAERNGYGISCISDSAEAFAETVKRFESATERERMGNSGYKYLKENYNVESTYNTIIKHFR